MEFKMTEEQIRHLARDAFILALKPKTNKFLTKGLNEMNKIFDKF